MKKILQITLFFIATFSFATLSFAERFEGEDRLLTQAKNGDQSAQIFLSRHYCKLGDYPEALYWMEKEAEHPGELQLLKQNKVADAYVTGSCDRFSKEQIYSPNYHKAIQWYQRVAFSKETKQSDPFTAKLKLANIYFFGKEDIAKDGLLAKHYYQELANISDHIIQNAKDELEGLVIRETRGNARHRLAQMYYFGNFARQDFQQAYHWAKKGWQDENYLAGMIVAVLQYEGKGTQQNREAAKKLMGDICDKYAMQQACDWYQDMRDNRPLRKGDI